MNGTGIMLCDDLIFFSRVAATAKATGLKITQARTMAKALEFAGKSPPGGIIIDLNLDSFHLHELLTALGELGSPKSRTIGYASHIDVTTLRAARMSGCDVVLPRSQFVEQLDVRLAEWLTPHAA